MKSRICLLSALALVTAACGAGAAGTGDVAATVNGEELTISDIEQFVSGESVAEDRFRQELQDAIVSQIILTSAMEQFGIDPSEEDVTTSYDELVAQIEAQAGGDYEAGLESIGYTDERVVLAAREQLVGQALQEELAATAEAPTDAELDEAFADGGTGFYSACVKHILVETEEDAQTVLDRLEAGEDFGELAMEVSTDTGSGGAGGDLGCTTLDRYVPEFSEGVTEAVIGEPFGPVESQFGFHIILVDSIDDEATARTNAASTLASDSERQVLLDWVDEAIAAAEVTVAPEYGEWVTDPAPSIIPPGGADESSGSAPTGTEAPSVDE